MKKIILDKALFSEIIRINTTCDSYVSVLKCSLFKLHDNSELYACLHSNEGTPCNLYIADNSEDIAARRDGNKEKEWIEVVGKGEADSIVFCRETANGIEKSEVVCGEKTAMISTSLCQTMSRLSSDANEVTLLCHKKKYGNAEKEAFQKRSVIDLATVDSRGVDIIYFEGADKLVEKLLYGGCRELTVFVTEVNKAKSIRKSLEKISKKAPFSNRIAVVCGERYNPRTASRVLVGRASDMKHNVETKIFMASSYGEGEGLSISVGQNTEEMIPDVMDGRVKPHAIHYITSIMSELVLRSITAKTYSSKRLFKVNAKNLITETIIKED